MGCLWALPFTVFLCFSVIYGDSNTKTFIVRVDNNLKPSVFSSVEHWYKTTLQSLNSNPLNSEKPKTINQDFLHVYKTVFHGFSASLTTQQAEELKKHPSILAVLPDRLHQLHTTRSPAFLGLSPTNPNGLLAEANFGDDVIVGVFDTGIWPERRSFRDKGLGPVPSRWKGECTEGERFSKTLCNRKIIGARYFTAGYEAENGRINISTGVRSARDSDGHGSHTASTIAGNLVRNASLFGLAKGVASGIAPKARIAVYKVCWYNGCKESDILAAFDRAVEDGVDIISLSLGASTVPYYDDPIAIGSFGAMQKGILVSASAGNDGPFEMTVENVAPWITTVGASTIDRNFTADLLLGNGQVIAGASLYGGKPLPQKTYLPLIYAADIRKGEGLCLNGTLEKYRVRGKIVLCDRGLITRVEKGEIVKEAGGAGVIVANIESGDEFISPDPHVIPGMSIAHSARETVLRYINSSSNPKATIIFRGTQVGVKPSPMVASFSSRGPNTISNYVVKPDIIAPGVNILAAWTDLAPPTESPFDKRRTAFNIISGTSMSCPHVAGIAVLLKGVYPDWSPAMIRSAMMTTAYMHDHDGKPLVDEESLKKVTVQDMGAGHVDPKKAMDPGLVYDLTVHDYLDFLCASNYSRREMIQVTHTPVKCRSKQNKPWNINYPAIAVVFNASAPSSEVVVKRTVTQVSHGASSYHVKVSNPRGAIMTVDPPKMEFKKRGQKKSFVVRISAGKSNSPPGIIYNQFGKLTWTDGKHHVNSPVVIAWQ
ncbi:subtilisin-like protease SBT1.5 [Cornus florida]|uniref:subtilisin-like protease SBT1.5 n=1 Tax=Cornus florida TaxID=4283 RepID=UPI002899FAEC|nr:subtilisin-like protease SBT1.5 [Cornus florida]